jgi:hypothetical protein
MPEARPQSRSVSEDQRDSARPREMNGALTIRLRTTEDSAEPSPGRWNEPSWVLGLAKPLAWPIAIVLILWMFRTPLTSAIGRLRSWKGFGQELGLTEEAARAVTHNVQETFESYRKQTIREYDRVALLYGVRERLEQLVNVDLPTFIGPLAEVPNFRCTLHVPDALFNDSLYQLLDYYPRGGGRGRISLFGSGSSASHGEPGSRAPKAKCQPIPER